MSGVTNKIVIDENNTIVKGNFAFVLDELESDDFGREAIYKCCLEAESKLKTDYSEALSRFRIAFETIGYILAIKNEQSESGISYKEARNRIDAKITYNKNNNPNPDTKKGLMLLEMKRLYSDTNKDRNRDSLIKKWKQEFHVFPRNSEGIYKNSDELIEEIGKKVYAISSKPHHDQAKSTSKEAEMVAQYIYSFLATECGHKGNFDINRCPIEDYYPISKNKMNQIGVSNPAAKLFIREQTTIQYYLFKPVSQAGEQHKRRDLEILDSLWNQSLNTPNNVVYMRNEIGTDDYRFQIMYLPSRPETLDTARGNMSNYEKRKAIKDIVEAVRSLHHMTPQVTHRAMCPLDFFVCRTSLGIRTILYQFDYAKQWVEDQDYTVVNRLDEISDTNIRSKFVDAKLIYSGINEGNAGKADIYSLGELIKYILGEGLDEQTRQYVSLMTNDDIEKRPTIDDVFNYMYGKGTGLISYSIRSVCSVSRKKTQDAFLSSGCKDLYDNDYEYNDVAVTPYYAGVFDGLGGAYYGDYLSRFVAQKAAEQLKQWTFINNEKYFLDQFAMDVQQQSLEYMSEEEIDYAGTTMALAIIADNKIHVENVGDSRGYIIDESGITQLTRDHRYSKSISQKTELYQYLGMDEDNGTLSPYTETYEFGNAGYVLLCTDGLTDFVDDEQIKNIVTKNSSLSEKTRELADTAKNNGSKDDITIILIKRGL